MVLCQAYRWPGCLIPTIDLVRSHVYALPATDSCFISRRRILNHIYARSPRLTIMRSCKVSSSRNKRYKTPTGRIGVLVPQYHPGGNSSAYFTRPNLELSSIGVFSSAFPHGLMNPLLSQWVGVWTAQLSCVGHAQNCRQCRTSFGPGSSPDSILLRDLNGAPSEKGSNLTAMASVSNIP